MHAVDKVPCDYSDVDGVERGFSFLGKPFEIANGGKAEDAGGYIVTVVFDDVFECFHILNEREGCAIFVFFDFLHESLVRVYAQVYALAIGGCHFVEGFPWG